MSYPITVNHLQGIPENPYRNGVGAYEGVVCHATANNNDSDEGERSFEQGHWQNAFVHYFVDADSIIETASPQYGCWGAGHTANQRYVQIELCQPIDQAQFQQAYARYVWLIAKKLADKKLGVKDGVTCLSHKQVSDMWHESNHQDPIEYLASHGVSWSQHIANVTAQYNSLTAPPKPPKHVVTLLTDCNLRDQPSPNGKILRVLSKGSAWIVNDEQNGYYNVGGWVTANPKYVTYK
jgi:N-acetylmuramoyl-L-alanine amidase CwlA